MSSFFKLHKIWRLVGALLLWWFPQKKTIVYYREWEREKERKKEIGLIKCLSVIRVCVIAYIMYNSSWGPLPGCQGHCQTGSADFLTGLKHQNWLITIGLFLGLSAYVVFDLSFLCLHCVVNLIWDEVQLLHLMSMDLPFMLPICS